MDKVRFQGIIDLYAEDYNFIQDTIEEAFVTLTQQLLNTVTLPCVLRGFTLAIGTVNTTFNVNIDSGIGGVITSDRVLVSTRANVTGQTPTHTNATNRVYVKYSRVPMSYDRSAGALSTAALAFDFSTQSTTYNRLIDSFEIVTLLQADYDALTTAQKAYYVYIGSLVVDGSGVITSVDMSTVNRIQLNIPTGSIVENNLSPTLLVDSHHIRSSNRNSANESEEDDNYNYETGIPTTLVEELNKIKTIIKDIKSTVSYDTVLTTGVQGYIPSMIQRYKPGILDEFTVSIINGGTQIQVDLGTAIYSDRVKSTFTAVTLDIAPYTLVPQNNITTIGGSAIYFGNQPSNVTLPHIPVLTSSVVIIGEGNTVPYTTPHDYTVVSATGVITSVVSGDLVNENVTISYSYGQYRYDYVYLDVTGLHYAQGAPSESTYPTLPYLSPDVGIILFYIYRPALVSTVSSQHIIVPNNNLPDQKMSSDISVTLDNNVSYYNSSFYSYREWGIHQITLVNSSTYVPTESGWSIGTVNGVSNLLTVSNKTTTLQTIINTQNDDELWLSIILPTQTVANTANDLLLELSYTTDGTTFTSNTFSSAEYIIVLSNMNTTANSLAVTLLKKGFTKGLHKVRLKIASASTAGTMSIQKLTVGKLDLSYETKGRIINGDVVINGDLRVNGGTVSSGTQENATVSNKITINVDGSTTTARGSGFYTEVDGVTEAGYIKADSTSAGTTQIKAPTGTGILTLDTVSNGSIRTDSASGTKELFIDVGTSRVNQDVRSTASPTFYGNYLIRSGTSPFSFLGTATTTGGGVTYTQTTDGVESEPTGRYVLYRRTSGTSYSVMSFSPTSSVAFFRGAVKLSTSTSDITAPSEALHILRDTDPAIKLERTTTNTGAGTIRFNSADKSILFITE